MGRHPSPLLLVLLLLAGVRLPPSPVLPLPLLLLRLLLVQVCWHCRCWRVNCGLHCLCWNSHSLSLMGLQMPVLHRCLPSRNDLVPDKVRQLLLKPLTLWHTCMVLLLLLLLPTVISILLRCSCTCSCVLEGLLCCPQHALQQRPWERSVSLQTWCLLLWVLLLLVMLSMLVHQACQAVQEAAQSLRLQLLVRAELYKGKRKAWQL